MAYPIKGIKNESYTIGKVEDLAHLPNLHSYLISNNFDGKLYHMQRVIEESRKKPKTLLCYKAARHDTFVSIG